MERTDTMLAAPSRRLSPLVLPFLLGISLGVLAATAHGQKFADAPIPGDTPEPSTALLLGSGIVVLLMLRFLRRTRAQAKRRHRPTAVSTGAPSRYTTRPRRTVIVGQPASSTPAYGLRALL